MGDGSSEEEVEVDLLVLPDELEGGVELVLVDEGHEGQDRRHEVREEQHVDHREAEVRRCSWGSVVRKAGRIRGARARNLLDHLSLTSSAS